MIALVTRSVPPRHLIRAAACWLAGSFAAACASAPAHPSSAAASPRPYPSSAPALRPAGLNQPENIVYHSVADVYLVSNMGGGDTAHDDNGFISRLRPDGTVLDARWIAGGVRGATLDAPKGLAIRGDTLAVADLGAVHLFDRRTGAPLRTIAVPGLVLNDLAYTADGTLWITDTGPARAPSPVDTSRDMDAVWRVTPDGRVSSVARGLALSRPDGIVLEGADALVSTFGALAVSSWDAQAVWRVTPGQPPRTLLTGVPSPAGIAVDTRHHRLAVTSMQQNALYLVPLS